MATCAELEQQAQQKANDLTSLAAEGNKASAYNIVSADLAERFGSDAARVLIRINETLLALERIKSQQESGGCTVTGYRPQINAAKAAQTNLNSFIDKMDAIIRKAREEQAATQKATTSTSNAGTGTPGTAGKAPTTNDLQEVTVTGKKTPTPVDPLQEVTVTGRRTATADDLTGVTVTGKKSPPSVNDLTEVTPTGKRVAQEQLEEVSVTGKRAPNTTQGIPASIRKTQAQATLQDTTNFKQKADWRVRLSLSPGATYLYKDPSNQLLAPLALTEGVIFPYTPSINVNYNASYDAVNPTHSNYKIFQYQNSSVDQVTISCDFTAQDTFEANYLLAVIHFFRSATKMFYGQDQNPKPGTPPPLVYLFGLGEFQFNAHPMVITNFSYNLPTDVDYIRAGSTTTNPGVSTATSGSENKPKSSAWGQILQNAIEDRLKQGLSKLGNAIGLSLTPGGSLSKPNFGAFNSPKPPGTVEPTYVPTKINLSISCNPIVSRYDVSNTFSLKEYANGSLLQGVKRSGGGIW